MATDLKVKVGADLTGFKSGMAALPGIAKGAAIAVAAAFAVGSAAILKASKVGMEFEQTLTETATVAQAFGKDLKALENKARELGRTTAFTATEAARGMYDLASAGMSTREIVDSVEYAMKLAGATGSEMSQATHILAASLKQFGMDASESRRITDTFAAAITNSQLTMVRLTEGMKDAGNAGSSLGWSVEETVTALAQFVNIGLEGSRAGTSLKMAMVQLVKQTDHMKEALSEMGLTYKDINPETHTFGEILRTLGERSMTTGQAIAIFGGRVSLAMKTLVKRTMEGKVSFEELHGKIIEAQEGVGRTVQMYDRMMNTFKNKWVVLKSAISDLFISFFNTFKNEGKDLFESWTDDINNLAQFIRDNGPEITRFFEDLAAVINAAAKTMIFFIKNTGQLIIKLHELKEQTVEGVKETAGAIKESWNYVPQFFNDLVMAWYDLADELQKKDLATFFKEQFLTSGHEISKFVAKTKTNQESLDKIMRKLDPTYYHVIDTLIAMGNAVDDTYTDWQDVSKKTTDNVNKDTNKFIDNLINSTKELEKLDDVIQQVFSDIDTAEKNLSEQTTRMLRDVDRELEIFFHGIEIAADRMYDYAKAVEYGIAVQDDLYDQDFGHWYDGMSKATQMWGKFSEGAKNALEKARASFITLEQAGEQMMEGFIESSRDLMGDVFYDVMTGQFDDISDAFSNFFDGILRKFTDLLGEMVANDILKKGLDSTWAQAGLAGVGAYSVASMLTSNQNRRQMAGLGSSAGYMIGSQYGYGGYAALAGAALGYILGGSMSGGNYASYSWTGANLGARITDNEGLYPIYSHASKLSGWGEGIEGLQALNKAQDIIADSLTEAMSVVPVEIMKQMHSDPMTAYNLYKDPMTYQSAWSSEKFGLRDWPHIVQDYIDSMQQQSLDYLDTIAKTMGQGTWEKFEEYMTKFENASAASATTIVSAFMQAFDTGEYTWQTVFDAFRENLYDSIFNTVKEGMINAFLESEAFRSALRPFFMQFQAALEASTTSGFLNPAVLSYQMGQIDYAGLLANIEALRPAIEQMAGIIDVLDMRIYGRAEGGPVRQGQAYIVGEQQPELFVPDSNGYIHPNVSSTGDSRAIVFINRGVMTESEFFARSMRQYQDYRQGDTLQTVDVSVQGLRLG